MNTKLHFTTPASWGGFALSSLLSLNPQSLSMESVFPAGSHSWHCPRAGCQHLGASGSFCHQGLDVELVHWARAEPEAPLEKSSTLLRGKSNPEISSIHQTSQGKGKSKLGHSSSSPHSQDRLVRKAPSLAQTIAPRAPPAGPGLDGARLCPGHDAHGGFGMCSQHWEPSLLQESSSSQGKQQGIYGVPIPALPR